MEYTTAWQDEIQISRVEETADIVIRAEKSDSQLVELILTGDETAFEILFERYKRLVASIAGRYFRRPEQIEEVIQISFTKVYFQLKNYRGEQNSSIAGWLARITTNICFDLLRVQKRKPENLLCEYSEPESESLFAAATNTESGVIERDLAEKLLSQLRDEDRALLQMLDMEEMTIKEISEITGWSISKIKVRAFRARRVLRKIIKRFL